MGTTPKAKTAKGPNPYAAGEIFNFWFLIVTVALGVGSVCAGWGQGGWGALYMALVFCPTVNIILMILGTVTAWIINRRNPVIKLGFMLPGVLGFPLLAALFTVTAILMMPLRGC